MTTYQWISFIAAGGHLALAVLVMWRGGRSPMALPLSLLCLDLFTWNFATMAYQASSNPTWHWIDVTFSPFTPPLSLHLILAFVGRLRSMRLWLLIAYVAFGLLSASSALAFLMPWAREWIDSSEWSLVYLIGWIPVMFLCLAVLIIHVRRSATLEEKTRARMIIVALIFGGILGSSELWDDLIAVPALGNFGTLGSTALLTVVVLRLRLFGRELSSSTALYALLLAALGVFGYLVGFRLFAGNTAVLVTATTVVTLALLAATREVVAAMSARKARRQQLTTLGRFASQMAHDLKNPLAALKGAIQYLAEERVRGAQFAEQGDFLELMAQQVERLGGTIDKYERLGRVEPVFAPVGVNELVTEVLALQRFAADPHITVEAHLAERLPCCWADRDLLGNALENVVRNAFEAMSNGGTLRVGTSRTGTPGVDEALVITVEDTGEGMDARQRERAFDDFYTTKDDGSGLGLAFVSRVVEAHEGRVSIESQTGAGTTVSIHLPVDPGPRN